MVPFEFKRSYGSIEELRAHLGGDDKITILEYALEVIVSHDDDDDIVVVFEIDDDGSLRFLDYEAPLLY